MHHRESFEYVGRLPKNEGKSRDLSIKLRKTFLITSNSCSPKYNGTFALMPFSDRSTILQIFCL